MAEDLFRAGRLVSVAIDDEAPLPVRRMHDLERFLDRLALVKPAAQSYQSPMGAPSVRRANVLSWAVALRKRMAALLRLKEYAESMDAEQLASFPPYITAPSARP